MTKLIVAFRNFAIYPKNKILFVIILGDIRVLYFQRLTELYKF